MKRLSVFFPVLLLLISLSPTAHADVIFSPVLIAVSVLARALPWLLVAAVIVLTVILLRKFRKKK